MELQLGLGLPGGGNCKSSMMKQLGFDLNNCFDHRDQQYNYNSKGHHHHHVFAASCSSNSNTNQLNVDVEIKTSTKRSFDEAFDHDHQLENSPPDHVPQTLPLLVWTTTTTTNSNLSDQDDNINDHDLDTTTSSSIIINKNELGEIESGIIGWPPVKSSRKKLCHHHKHGGEYSKSMFVKVKMEGVGIARKVDLTLHASYHTLTNTLMAMFGKCQEDVKSYNLTYQDKEGDWLLAGDVPWGSFIETVQRLKLLKNGG